MSLRKFLAAFAAITAVLALTIPVAGASAATIPGSQSTLCALLQQQKLLAGPTMASLLSQVMVYMNC
jgi:hypothetical protein